MTRRFDIGPFVLALGALLLLVGLFLAWYGELSAWDVFELTDVLLAALAVAAIVGAVGLLTPDADYVDKRFLPWIVGAAFVLVAAQLLDPPPVAAATRTAAPARGSASAATILMVAGTVLSLTQRLVRGRRRGP